MPASDIDQEKARLEQELRIQQQIAFASGLFQGDVTVRTLLESIAEGVVITDASGTILLVNARAEQMFGYQRKDLIGKPHAVLVPERFRNVHEAHAAHFFTEPGIRPMGQLLDLAGRRQDGSEFPVEISLSFIETVNGVLALAFVSDITERKRVETALREEERKLRNIVEHSTNLFYMHTADHILTYISPQSRQFFDCEPEEALVRWTEFISDNPVNRFAIEATQRAIDTGQRQPPYQVECIGRTGRKIWTEVNETPVVVNGKTVAVVGSLTDITERKRAEEALRFSEARYRALYSDNPTMIATLDADLTMLSVNPSCASQLGYTIDELEGQPVLKIFFEDDRTGVAAQLRRCLQNPNQVYRWQFRKVRKDGELLWVEEVAQAVYDLNGALNVLVVCQDITERRQAEEALRKSELKLSKIFHSVPALIGITTLAEGRCIDMNETGLRVLGYRREEVVGKTMLELGVWESRAERDHLIRRLEEYGTVRDFEATLRRKDGVTLRVLFSADFIDFNGDRYMLSIVKDITERKRMEEEIARLNADLAGRAAELEAAYREMEAFNYTVAHDLRKPLTAISGFCQVLREVCGNRLDEQCKGYLQEVYDGTWRMNRLIDALLNFSHLAHIEPHRENVDLSAMAQEVAAELRLSEPARRVTFHIAEGLQVQGDVNLLRVVLDNLLGNAWKYTGSREEGVVELDTTEVDGKTVCFVRDNGTGFDMANADKLFTPFQRLPGAQESEGFGIGLATVERIVRRHGGRVWAEGEPGKGATFYFTLGGDRTI
ncbi:MAG TPA: PAS domain S-box protein [Desulfuromonadales bacterium]